MSLWNHPRLTAALCTVAVLGCAAAPAVFLAAADAASLGRVETVADPYVAPTPTADDYYILRQLAARSRNAETEREQRPAEVLTAPKMYIGASASLQSMQYADSAAAEAAENALRQLAEHRVRAGFEVGGGRHQGAHVGLEFVGNDVDALTETLILNEVDVKEVKQVEDNVIRVLVSPKELAKAKDVLSQNGVEKFDVAETKMIPVDVVDLDGEEKQKLKNLLDALDEVEDVQSVFHNANI